MPLRVVRNLSALAPGSVRLFCLPYAGGSAAAIYREWQTYAPGWLHICPAELPGRGWLTAETPLTSMNELTDLMTSALQPHTNTTYAIFGHSMGALLGYEIAARLEKSGAQPACKLFASGSRAPFAPSRLAPVSHLPYSEFLDHLRELQGTPEEVFQQEDLMALLLPVVRADFAVGEQYLATTKYSLQSPITIFSGDSDEHASVNDMILWRDLTHAVFRSHQFSGGHFFLNEQIEQVVRSISEELTPCCTSHPAAHDGTSQNAPG